MRFPIRRITLLIGSAAWFLTGCGTNNEPDPPVPPTPTQPLGTSITSLPADIALKWAAMSLRVTANTPANTPTYASRAFGYLGLTLYETTVYGMPDHQSLVARINGLTTLPQPESGKIYDWVVSLNAGQHYLLRNLYSHTPMSQLNAVDSLERVIRTEAARSLPTDVIDRSVLYGRSVAEAIFQWSKGDGGHEGYKNAFPTDYQLATAPGSWVPPDDGQVAIRRALHPRWGSNRTFAAANGKLAVPKPLSYSQDTSSAYYKQYKAIYTLNKRLTQADKEAAIWWSDDPSQTFTPPGHSYNLASIAVKTTRANLAQAVETYARVGMAIADAFICCFKCKYTYTNERPSAFIRANIDRTWFPFWPEPPFPGFSSGHATQGAATAAVLTDLYGPAIAFTDSSHVGRPRDALRNVDFKARSFKSFWEAAEESGGSRLLGGIHTQQDNEVGLSEGRKIGGNINQLPWKK